MVFIANVIINFNAITTLSSSSSSPPGLASKCVHFVTRDIAGRDMRRELKLEWSLRLQPRRFQNVTHRSQRVSSELLYRHQVRSSTCFANLAKPVKYTITRLPLGWILIWKCTKGFPKREEELLIFMLCCCKLYLQYPRQHEGNYEELISWTRSICHVIKGIFHKGADHPWPLGPY